MIRKKWVILSKIKKLAQTCFEIYPMDSRFLATLPIGYIASMGLRIRIRRNRGLLTHRIRHFF